MRRIKYLVNNEEYLILFMVIVSYFSLSKIFYDYLSWPRRIFLVWGVFFLIKEFFLKRDLYKNKYSVILFAFCIANGISTLLNFSDRFVYGMVTEAYVCVFLIVFFVFSLKQGRDQKTGFIKKIQWIHIILSFVFAVLALGCFALNISVTYNYNGNELYLGLMDNRVWGFYNPNTGGSICVISLVFSYMQFGTNRGKSRLFLILNMIFQYLYLILTLSRSAWYIFLGVIVLYGIFHILIPTLLCQDYIMKKMKKIVIFLCLFVAVLISPDIIKNTVVVIPNTIMELHNMEAEEEKIVSVSLERIDEEKIAEQDSTNGRVEIWKAGWEIFKTSPLFGVGSENIVEEGEQYLTGDRLSNLQKGGLHNSYLMILTSSGIIGFLIMAIFFGCLVIEGFWYLFRRKQKYVMLLVILILGMMANELMEARLVYNTSYLNIIFWILTGFVAGCFEYEKKMEGKIKK